MNKKDFIIIVCSICLLIVGIFLCKLTINNRTDKYIKEQKLLYKYINNTESEDKSFYFNGNVNNNYLLYNNLLWRIVKVNKSGTITIILDKEINYLSKNTNIIDYLNTTFLDELDKEYLVKNNLCNSNITDLNNVSCANKENNYVSLLDVNSYVKTILNNETFINNEGMMWLLNSYDDNNSWHVSNTNISYGKNSNYYKVKPVVTIKSTVLYEDGNGTIDNPYIIKNNNITVGSTIVIDNDEYVVISTKDNYKLMLNNIVDNNTYFNDVTEYLNTTYYNSLTYKNYLNEMDCNVFTINSGLVEEKVEKKYICLPNIYDLKLAVLNNYYLGAKEDNYYLVYDINTLLYGTKNIKHNIVPVISIKKDNNFTFKDGKYIMD